MNTKAQITCAAVGVMCPVMMFAGLITAGFLPLPHPSWDATQIAAMYQEHAARIRIGMAFNQIAGALMVVFASAVSFQMRQIKSGIAQTLSYVQLGSGIATSVPFIIPSMIWMTATFRPERSPELTLLLSDLGWIIFIGVFWPTVVENFAVGFAILSDKSERPVFPRWLAYYNIWLSILLTPSTLMPFFKTGPFAWNGLLVFWVPAIAFGSWFPVMFVYVIKAIKRQAASAG